MPKNLAKTLLYVSQVGECKSAEVERGADLRQPDVSVAMQELRERGWVNIQSFRKKKGKGRPTHIYKSVTKLSDIVGTLEQEKLKEFENIETSISELKNIVNET